MHSFSKMENPYDASAKLCLTFLSRESQISVTEKAWKTLDSVVNDFEQACLVMPDQLPSTWTIAVPVLRTWPSQVQDQLKTFVMMPRDNFHQLPAEFPAFIQVIKMLVFDWVLENPSKGWQFLTYFAARNTSWNMSKAFALIPVPSVPSPVPAGTFKTPSFAAEECEDAKFN